MSSNERLKKKKSLIHLFYVICGRHAAVGVFVLAVIAPSCVSKRLKQSTLSSPFVLHRLATTRYLATSPDADSNKGCAGRVSESAVQGITE